MVILNCIALLLGFLILFKSAEQCVIGARVTANIFSISPVVVGLTIVALGTSAPEIFIAVTSSWENRPELAVGNAIGSNIANLGLVLGITTLIVPLNLCRDVLRHDLPILLFVTICAGIALINLELGIWDGLLLISVLGLFLARLSSRHRRSDPILRAKERANLRDLPQMSNKRAILILLLSLAALLLSAELIVWSASSIAQRMGISELVIGLTVIAAGTSLPELVVTLTSASKGQPELAVGNIMGSNIFNILAVLAIPCLMAPTAVAPALLFRDYATMLILTLLLLAFAYGPKGGGQASIGRSRGVIFLSVWVGYLLLLYYSAPGLAA